MLLVIFNERNEVDQLQRALIFIINKSENQKCLYLFDQQFQCPKTFSLIQ